MVSSITSSQSLAQVSSLAASSSSATSFAQALETASSSTFWLDTTRAVGHIDPNRPTSQALMDMGMDYHEATFKIYSVANGEYPDTRDWGKIMNASDPLVALNEATDQFLNSLPKSDIMSSAIDQEGNFALFADSNASGNTIYRVGLVTDSGHLLRKMGASTDTYFESIEKMKSTAEQFGFKTDALDKLVSPTIKQEVTMYTPSPIISTTPTTPITPLTPTTDPNLIAITNLYKSYLNREPDQEGLTYWSGKLSDGATLQDIENAFYLSEEFVALSEKTISTTTTIPNNIASTAITQIDTLNPTLEDLLKYIS